MLHYTLQRVLAVQISRQQVGVGNTQKINKGKEACLYKIMNYNSKKVKDKSVPLQAWSGPEGSRKLKFSDFTTTAQDGGKVVSLTYRPPLPSGNTPGTRFC